MQQSDSARSDCKGQIGAMVGQQISLHMVKRLGPAAGHKVSGALEIKMNGTGYRAAR